MFLGDYLTSEGQAGPEDLEMIADAGFTVEGAAEPTLPEHRRDLVRCPAPRPRHPPPGQHLAAQLSGELPDHPPVSPVRALTSPR